MAGSRWVRLDTGYFTNPKVMSVDRDAMLLHLVTIAWCGDQLTDGKVDPSALPLLTTMARIKGAGERQTIALVDAGLYLPNGRGWHLHDFDEMNGTRSEVEAERAAWRERQRRARARRRGESHGETDA